MTDENNEVICSNAACRKTFKAGDVAVASKRFTVVSIEQFGPFRMPTMTDDDVRKTDYWHEECLG